MSKKCTNREILERIEDKINQRLENQELRIESLERFRAYSTGAVTVIVAVSGAAWHFIRGLI
jgi:hypothetical protein